MKRIFRSLAEIKNPELVQDTVKLAYLVLTESQDLKTMLSVINKKNDYLDIMRAREVLVSCNRWRIDNPNEQEEPIY